ncbi:MAG: HPF/RaiA family ribosome-associated protein [Vicinamibacterales bacterium]
MRIFVRPSAGWPSDVSEQVQKRLEFAMGRFAGRVRSLSVRLTDLNGPRGGVDKKCLIAVRLDRPRRVIVIEDVDADESALVGRAADRAARAVSRAIQAAADWRATARHTVR